MGLSPLSPEVVDVWLVGSAPDGPIDSPHAGFGRSLIQRRHTRPHQPIVARSAWATGLYTLAHWQSPEPVSVPSRSTCSPVRSTGHSACLHRYLDDATAGRCARLTQVSEPPVPVWLLKPSLHREGREPAAALAVHVVVLVPPNGLGFFFENQ